MNVLCLANIHVIQMQHARIMLAHTHVNAIVDLAVVDVSAVVWLFHPVYHMIMLCSIDVYVRVVLWSGVVFRVYGR